MTFAAWWFSSSIWSIKCFHMDSFSMALMVAIERLVSMTGRLFHKRGKQ